MQRVQRHGNREAIDIRFHESPGGVAVHGDGLPRV
jgi:hypothetical protein